MRKLRALSLRQAANCENAKSPASKCRCRCGGKHHGAARICNGERREVYESLPDDDPHKLPVKETARQRREREFRERQIELDIRG